MGTVGLWTVRKQEELLMGLRVKENKAEGRGRTVNSQIYLLNTSFHTKDCTQHPVGKIKYIHMKTTRTQTAYGRDEQIENAVV